VSDLLKKAGTGSAQTTYQVSVVVPIYNEAVVLPRFFSHHAKLLQQGVWQWIFVDGGSTDQSRELMQHATSSFANVCMLESQKGRSAQQSLGLAKAIAPYVVFLHVDTLLPANVEAIFARELRGVNNNDQKCWGRFNVKFEEDCAPMMHVVAWFMNQRSRLTGIATGDQAIFVNKLLLQAVGGLPNQALMEDVELSKRLKRHVPPVCLAEKVETSSRRWQKNGVWRTILLMWRLRYRYFVGDSPQKLTALYNRD